MVSKSFRYQLLGWLCAAMILLLALIGQMRQSGYTIDVGISATRSLTADMRVPEKIQIGSQLRTMRWSYQDSHILLPQTLHNAIVVVHTMTRAEDAPAYISMRSGSSTVSIDPTAGLRSYAILVSHVSPLVFDCDTSSSTSTLSSLCVAIDTVNVSWTSVSHVDRTAVRWFIGLIAILITIILVSIPAQRWPLRIMIALPLAALLLQYGVQLQPLVPGLTIALGATRRCLVARTPHPDTVAQRGYADICGQCLHQGARRLCAGVHGLGYFLSSQSLYRGGKWDWVHVRYWR